MRLLALALLGACGAGAQTIAAWTAVGPGAVATASFGKVTGRVSAVAFDPNDASGNTVYLGTTGGGVWKSSNAAGVLGGVTFAPLTDTLPVFAATANGGAAPSLTIGALAVQPVANPVVLAGTGDPNNATDSLYGVGLLRSADGGLTWTLATGSNDGVNGKHSFMGLAAAGLAWSTASPGVVVAAMTLSPQAAAVGAATSSSVAGLYYSTDAGVTWRMATVMDGSQIVQQPVLSAQPSNPATAVVWDAARGSFYAAVRFHGYYASADGATWTRLAAQPGSGLTAANCPPNAGGTGSTGCPIFRGAMAVQPATGDLYALTVDASNGDQGLWQDLCSLTSAGVCATKAPVWGARVDAGALDTAGAVPQGVYNLALSAVPATGGGTLLLAGSEDVYRCSLTAAAPSSCAWRNTTNAVNGCATPAGVAAAQHALAGVALAASGPLVMVGNDGGLWRSTDGVAETGAACSVGDAAHFDNLNGAIGSLAEVVGLAQAPSDAGSLIAGLGADGTAATGASSVTWPQVAGGEGGLPLIDPNTPSNWFATVGAGVNLKLCTKGSACAASDFAGAATIGSAQVGGDAALLHAPVLLDPALTSSLIVGTCRVWRGPSTDGTLWSSANAISPAMDGGSLPCSATSALVKSVAAGGPVVSAAALQHSGSTVIYAGMAGALDGGGASVGGHVFVTKAASTATGTIAWTDVAKSPVTNVSGGVFNPGGYDVSVAADPHDATGGTLYAAVAGFGGDVTVPHLYRSIDFGAHWATVSANLPGAPANAVVVDPNDANTVYVATDAGVFVTQAIATCATQSCWSLMGTGLPNSPAVALAAGANLPTGDGRTGLLRVGTYGRGIWQIPLLTAVTQAQPAVVLSANSLTFAAQPVGTQSGAQTVTVTSSGNAPAVFGKLVIRGDFTETDTCAGQTLPVGSACTVNVVFAPGTTGTRAGLLTMYANVSGGQATVSLTGTGTAPASVVLTPTALTFGATTVGQTSAAIGLSVANTGGANSIPVSINSITANGDFAVSSTACGTTLLPQNACQVNVTFMPAASGTRTGTLTVVDSVGTQTATLTGTGQAPPTDTLTPLSLSFAQQAIGSASMAQTVMLANAGDQALTLLSTSVNGDFSAVNGCGAIVAAHTTCAVSVQFVPTATGTRTGVLTVSDAYRAQTVPLTGVGVAPAGVSLTPVAVSFAATGVGLVSAVQAVTLTNNGGLPLGVSGVSVSAGFVLVGNGCGSTLAAGAACVLQVAFAPVASRTASGMLVLTDNAGTGSQTVTLTGTGVDFTLAANGPTTVTVASGAVATFPMLLTSAAGLSGNVALACAGAPAHSVCTVSPNVGALGTTVSVTVTVQTGTARLSRPWLWGGSGVVLAFLLPVGFKRRRVVGVLLGSVLLVGCGTARLIPGETGGAASTPTASGTYALTVSATGAGVTHSVPLTLVVQ